MHSSLARFIKEVQAMDSSAIGPASSSSLALARRDRFPPELIDFYRAADPQGDMIESHQRIWSISKAVEENRDYIPGCYLSKLGYVVFASTLSGDAYCLDKNAIGTEGFCEVVLFPHDEFEAEMDAAEARMFRVPVAASLYDFLDKFLDEDLPDDPYPDVED